MLEGWRKNQSRWIPSLKWTFQSCPVPPSLGALRSVVARVIRRNSSIWGNFARYCGEKNRTAAEKERLEQV